MERPAGTVFVSALWLVRPAVGTPPPFPQERHSGAAGFSLARASGHPLDGLAHLAVVVQVRPRPRHPPPPPPARHHHLRRHLDQQLPPGRRLPFPQRVAPPAGVVPLPPWRAGRWR